MDWEINIALVGIKMQFKVVDDVVVMWNTMFQPDVVGELHELLELWLDLNGMVEIPSVSPLSCSSF